MALNYTVEFNREICPEHGGNTTICHEECDLYEENYLVDGSVTPVTRARTYGPPEDCHPAEGGDVEIENVTFVDECGNHRNVSDWEKKFTPKQVEEIEQKLFDACMSNDGFDDGPEDDDDCGFEPCYEGEEP